MGEYVDTRTDKDKIGPMGDHAFRTDPEHCAIYRGILGDRTPPLVGFSDRWNMPVAKHRAALPENAAFPGVDHYVMTFHIGGAKARRLDRPDWRVAAEKGALSLQAPRSGGVFASDGVVDYAHLYFRQSLLCEVAESTAQDLPPDVDDFFAVRDTECAADVRRYIQRANDADEPASPIEMDSRAYLIALGLLQGTRKRLILKSPDLVAPADSRFARVLEMIEDRLAEPVRISELARELDMSSFRFLRAFREAVGVTPGKYGWVGGSRIGRFSVKSNPYQRH